MDINFEALAAGLGDVLRESLNKDLPEIKQYANRIVEEQKSNLTDLAFLRLEGTITDEEFEAEVEGQKEVVANQLRALSAMSKAAAQKAANAALKFLSDSILKIIKLAL